MSEPKKRNWGNPFSIISLIMGIFALVMGLLALIPLIGLPVAYICLVFAILAIIMAIPGVIGSIAKGKAICGFVFGGTMLVWSIARIMIFVAALAEATTTALV